MLTTTTHSKLREALDGIDTQVAICAIDRWTTKMKRTEGYITREISRRRGTTIRKMPGSSIGGVSEEEKKKSSSAEDRGWALTFPPNHAVDDPVPRRSRPTVEGVLTKAQFSSPLLYQIHCIGPVGFWFAHFYSERSSPNRDPTLRFLLYVIFNFITICSIPLSLCLLLLYSRIVFHL